MLIKLKVESGSGYLCFPGTVAGSISLGTLMFDDPMK